MSRLPPMLFTTCSHSMIRRPSRVLVELSASLCSSCGPAIALIASKRWMRAFCFVLRACAPRRIHSSSRRRMELRLRACALSMSSRAAFCSR